MNTKRQILKCVFLAVVMAVPAGFAGADDTDFDRFILELEAGPTWQSSNDVQIPNDEFGTRFSLKDLVGTGPWAAGRVYFTWNFKQRHGLRVLLAPLSYTETGIFDETVDFAGASYEAGLPTEATYQFNSWRLTYRYLLEDGERWKLWIGGTAKIRDAKIELRQGDTTSKDTDLGFVPLAHFGADYRFADKWHFIVDIDALAGGPGRAIDVGLKVGYDLKEKWSLTAGYRTVEGGVDIDDVYNFAWFNGAVVSGVFRF